MFDDERYTRWRRASHGLHLIESELVHTVQALGALMLSCSPATFATGRFGKTATVPMRNGAR
jgi:hypothetical protein